MATILCPTRGGEPSYPNQDRAIAIAKERGADLVFVYVTNLQFLNRTASPVVVDVEQEIDDMGEFLLVMARERAAKMGLTAESVVKHGVFQEALLEAIEENEATTVVMGTSQEDTGITTREYLDELTDALVEEAGVEVILVRDGEIVSTRNP